MKPIARIFILYMMIAALMLLSISTFVTAEEEEATGEAEPHLEHQTSFEEVKDKAKEAAKGINEGAAAAAVNPSVAIAQAKVLAFLTEQYEKYFGGSKKTEL